MHGDQKLFLPKIRGIKSLVKVYSGYEVDSEVRAARFREKTGLPSVYFSVSVSRALADIKIMWAQVRNGINDAASRNEWFSSEDRHYIRGCMETENGIAQSRSIQDDTALTDDCDSLCIH